MSGKKKQIHRLGDMRAKLSFDEGFAENPIYSIKAKVSEKDKGVSMIHLIKQNFGISEEFFKRKMNEMHIAAMNPTEYPKFTTPVKWTRDEKGNIISPFRSKRKIV